MGVDFSSVCFIVIFIASFALVPLQRSRLRRSLFALYSTAADVAAATATTVTS